jgi:hypothetical protein
LKNLACLSNQFAASADRCFKFEKSGQLFIRSHNETLSVATMRICNPDCSTFAIYRRDTAPTPSGFLEIVSDDFMLCRAWLLSVEQHG